jgi:hypothetical protein
MGQLTASGDIFNPTLPTAAIALPKNQVLRPFYLYLQVNNGACIKVLVNDKMNERWIGKRGFDLTPTTVFLSTRRWPTDSWTGSVSLCIPKKEQEQCLTSNSRIQETRILQTRWLTQLLSPPPLMLFVKKK